MPPKFQSVRQRIYDARCELGKWLTRETILHLLLSASAGSIPGRLIVIADGAPTSYVRTGLWQTLSRTRVLNTTVDSVLTGALS